MADFTTAFNLLKGHEGGYGIDNNGYEVYTGINRKFNPNWQGWTVIDQIKKNYSNKNNWTDSRADIYVAPLYKSTYWAAIQGDKIINQTFANFLFDYFVASGNYPIIELQKILGVVADGYFGPKTLLALNNKLQNDGNNLYNEFWDNRYNFTKNLVPNVIPYSWWSGVEQRLLSFKNSYINEILKAAADTGNTIKKNPNTSLIIGTIALLLFIKLIQK
jgi:lysozyme family protein